MADPETLLTEIALGESPRWHEGRLWFSDWAAHEVVSIDLEGNREVVLRVPTFPFSIDWLPDGRLLLLADGRIQRREPDGSLVTHAALGHLCAYEWNEIVVDGRGNAYVNNIGFEFSTGAFAAGIIALVTPDGCARQVADGLAFPNGMAVTPDDSTLIVAESFGKKLTAFDIAADGGLAKRRVWADLHDGAPDGICLDEDGAIWFGDVPNKRCVRVREGGRVLQAIEFDRGCFACALGGAHGTTLFCMTAEWPRAMVEDGARTGRVLTVRAPAPRAGHP